MANNKQFLLLLLFFFFVVLEFELKASCLPDRGCTTWVMSQPFFFFFLVLGLELKAFTLNHSASPFCDRYFQDRFSQTICPSWLRTTILLISASWVAKITGMSHQHLALPFCFSYFSDKVLWFCPGQPAPQLSYLCLPCGWDSRCMPPCLSCQHVACSGLKSWASWSLTPK
jgi:hypothetical protein